MTDSDLLTPYALRINSMREPYGIDPGRARFSWALRGEGENAAQSSYRLVFSDSFAHMSAGEYLFDTDWVQSNRNTAVTVAGLSDALSVGGLYLWSVAARGKNGRGSGFCAPQSFTTGGELGEITGLWTRDGRSGLISDCDFAFFRAELRLSPKQLGRLEYAVLEATATSPEKSRQYVYNLYVNGSSVLVGPPRYGTTPDGRVALYYDSAEVRPLLVSGVNCVGAICYAVNDRAFFCRLTLYYSDGTSFCALRPGSDWFTFEGDAAFGKNNSVGTGYYVAAANNLDSTVYPHGFCLPGFEQTGWLPAARRDMARAMAVVPSGEDGMNRYDCEKRAIISRLPSGDYVVDLQKETVGGLKLSVNAPERTEIRLYYGEQLNPDGTVKYKMLTGNIYAEKWVLKKGEQTLRTLDLLTYRYVQISGCGFELTSENVTGTQVRAAWLEQAGFSSDSRLLNDIYELTRHTVKATTQNLYVDSQSRERGAYEGDALINLHAAYVFEDNYSIGSFTLRYLYTHRTWPAEYILLMPTAALTEYMYTADPAPLEEYYEILAEKTFTRYYSEYDLVSTGNTGSSGENAVLVDWPGSERNGYDMGVLYNTVVNAVASHSYQALSEIARLTGHESDAEKFARLSRSIKLSMIQKLYDESSGAFADGLYSDGSVSSHFSQHASAYALCCGIYTDANMADKLAKYVSGRIKMSVYGAFFLLKGLYASGHGAEANALLLEECTEQNPRTWAYMLNSLGATLTTEAWCPENKGNMTFSHPWGAGAAYATARGIFGINPTSPGFSEFEVRYQTAGLRSASITVPTVKGGITAAFDTSGKTAEYSVTVPANTKAEVFIPACEAVEIRLNGTVINAVYDAERRCRRLSLCPGKWKITCDSASRPR